MIDSVSREGRSGMTPRMRVQEGWKSGESLSARSRTPADKCPTFVVHGCEVDYIFPERKNIHSLSLSFIPSISRSISSSNIDIRCCCTCPFADPSCFISFPPLCCSSHINVAFLLQHPPFFSIIPPLIPDMLHV